MLKVDASDTGLGAVLMQESEGEEFPIAYASKKLLPRETRYSTVEKDEFQNVSRRLIGFWRSVCGEIVGNFDVFKIRYHGLAYFAKKK